MPYLTAQGEELFYQERGGGGLALFLHGFALDHTLWLSQLSALAPLRHCVTMDLRGFGRSGLGLDPGEYMAHHVSDVIEAVAAFGGGPADLVGLSMGSHLARDVAFRRPELVRSLALFGIMSRDEYVFPATRSPALLHLQKDELARRYAGPMLSPDAALEHTARAVTMASELNWSILYAPSPRSQRDQPPDVLDAPGVPIMFATGDRDGITSPEAVARLAAKHQGATLTIVPGAGHLVPVEQPDAVNAALTELWSR